MHNTIGPCDCDSCFFEGGNQQQEDSDCLPEPPWAGEFCVDNPSDLDNQATDILMRNMRMGKA